MAEASRLSVYTIPPHRAFADALVAGLRRRFGDGATDLARGTVLVPNNRARRAITEAFVRASGGALLLPRIVAIGDPDLDEATGALFDPAGDATPVPPAVPPLQRRLILARLVQEADPALDAGEAVRLAGDLARTLDQLLVEEVAPSRLREIRLAEGLSQHWERALASFELVLDRWPAELARLGRLELAERRRLLFDRVAERWRDNPPGGFLCAAGITASAPAIARLLRSIAELRGGMVVLPGLDLAMDEDAWASLGPHAPHPETGHRPRGEPTHPQHHLKQLLDRMRVARAEVRTWAAASEIDAPPARSRAIATALAPAEMTHDWGSLRAIDRALAGVRTLEVGTPAEEAAAVALALREVLETPGRTAALVTPDRALARRVSVLLTRWGVAIDDTAGRPLSEVPPGTLLLALAEAAAGDFAPVPLLVLLKHPLVRSGDARPAWLEGVRALDLALRGPRPAPGLAGLGEHLAAVGGHAAAFWTDVRALLAPVERLLGEGARPLAHLLGCLREAATKLCGDALWSRAEGRAAAELLAELEEHAGAGPAEIAPPALAPLLRALMDEVAVRPPQGGHPRLAIYGLIEARLQSADLLILAGLNEGVWPGTPAPDPWLAPRIRAELELPGLDFRIGVAAHDLASGLGAPSVLLTRARRDARSPTIASRFWLRLRALASEAWVSADELGHWARALDTPGDVAPATRPAPTPPAATRPREIAVTDVDRLKADPYAFYAKKMLRLRPLDAIDAEPNAAWRGTAVHDILRASWAEDRLDADRLRARAAAWLAQAHPLLRAFWQPRLLEAIDWIGGAMADLRADGREVIDVERKGRIDIAGVTLNGTFDRIDRLGDGALAVVDYKTGKPPSAKAVRAGYSLQLGLLGLIAERGGFEGVTGRMGAFEYWSLGRAKTGFGFIASPVDPAGKRDRIPTDEFTAVAAANFADAAARWLTGEDPFTAKLVPEYAPYGEYDQLMRRDEWYGRD
ncbi:ATP-dependent helicase/nuclease subunit B [Sphingomonas guangdongensis]|uniref:ATP-dependent helicase/nuclease subunit B n=1 Tax=Sphingomonas guangdongensis TaxID=1141890 RepID=A0A285QYS9_9SPHN|nr:double-strand break repair protein AddB [Sphingomonas guangdongensis]SOB86986.1 ATP-dependent helicase/nuclease subunit B [Sphingomonas guangdongensis]